MKHNITLTAAAALFLIFTGCSSIPRHGEEGFANLEQTITLIAKDMKEKLPENSALIVTVADENPTQKQETMAENLAFKIVEIGAPKLSVLERSQLDKAMAELEKQSTDLYNEETSVPLGKLVGAQYMVMSEEAPLNLNLTKLKNPELQKDLLYQKFDLKVKVIELETGKIVYAARQYYWDIAPNQIVITGGSYQATPKFIVKNKNITFINQQKVVIKKQKIIKQDNQEQEDKKRKKQEKTLREQPEEKHIINRQDDDNEKDTPTKVKKKKKKKIQR